MNDIPCIMYSCLYITYLERGRTHEIFLFQTQLFAFKQIVVGVQNAGDIFSGVPVENGLNVITVVDYNIIRKKPIDFVALKKYYVLRISICGI